MPISRSRTKSLYAPSGSTAWTLQTEFTESSVNTANNTSTITLSCYLQSGGGSFSSGTNNTLVLVWHDNNENTDKVISILYVKSISANSWAETSGTYTATHKSDGTLSGYAKVVWTKNDNNGYTPASATLFADGGDDKVYTPLTTIARASVPTLSKSSFTLGTQITINTNRKSSSFTHTIRIKHSSINTTLVTKTANASYEMTQAQATAFQNAVLALGSTAKSYSVTFEVDTYNGNTLVGTNTVTGTANLTAAAHGPSYSNGTVSPSAIVKDVTTATVSVTVSHASGATLSRVSCTNGTQTVTMTANGNVYSCQMSNLTSKDFTVTATDSRGLQTSTTISASSYSEYMPPTFRNVSYSDGVLSFSGVWTSTNNSLSNPQYSINGGTASSYSYTTSGDTFSGSISLSGIESDQDYAIALYISDTHGTGAYTYQIKSDRPLFWLGKETARCAKHWIFEGDGTNGEIEFFPSTNGGIKWGNTVITKAIFDTLPSGGGGGGGITVETDPTVYSWAKQPNKPTYTAAEVGALPASTVIPSKTSDLTNDSGYITGYTETDPTVPSWAKASTKPTYTAAEVGALPSSTNVPIVSREDGSVKIVYNGTTYYAPDTQGYEIDLQNITDSIPSVTADASGRVITITQSSNSYVMYEAQHTETLLDEKISEPSGGTAGQVLTKTSSGVAWQTVSDAIVYGTFTVGSQTLLSAYNVTVSLTAAEISSYISNGKRVVLKGSFNNQALELTYSETYSSNTHYFTAVGNDASLGAVNYILRVSSIATNSFMVVEIPSFLGTPLTAEDSVTQGYLTVSGDNDWEVVTQDAVQSQIVSGSTYPINSIAVIAYINSLDATNTEY